MSHYDKAKEVLVHDFDALMMDRDKSAHDYLLYVINISLFNLIEALQADLHQVKSKLATIEEAVQRQR